MVTEVKTYKNIKCPKAFTNAYVVKVVENDYFSLNT